MKKISVFFNFLLIIFTHQVTGASQCPSIFELVSRGRHTTVQDLEEHIKTHPESIHAVDQNGQTALHIAAMRKMHVLELVALGFKTNACDKWGNTPLYYAKITFVWKGYYKYSPIQAHLDALQNTPAAMPPLDLDNPKKKDN